MAVGHPVDVASGAFFDALVDVGYPGSVPLMLERSYNTAFLSSENGPLVPAAEDARLLPFGPGWRAGWQVELRRTLDGFVYVGHDGTSYQLIERRDFPFEQVGKILAPADGLELRSIDANHVRLIGFGDDRNDYSLVFRRRSEGMAYDLAAVEATAEARLEFVYDPVGRVTSIFQRREARELLIQYDEGGRVVRADVRFPDRSTRFGAGYVYDHAGRLAEVHDDEGLSETYEYDDNGRIVRESRRGGSTYTVRYRNDGRCHYVSGTNRYQERTLRFDLERNATLVYDSHGAATLYECNASGQVLQVTSPLGNRERFEYDDVGRQIAVTSPGGIMVRDEYDDVGHLVLRGYPGGRSVSFTYDAEHRLVDIADSAGVRAFMTYDENNNLIELRADGEKPWRYAYNAHGECIAVENPTGARRIFVYDRYGNMTSESDYSGKTWTYEYNAAGQVIRATDPLGATTRVEYDSAGRPWRLTDADGRVWEDTVDSYQNIVRTKAPDGAVETVQYSDCGQITEIVRYGGQRIQLFWGTEPGELVAMRNSRGDEFTVRYDPDGRIVERKTFDGRRIVVEWEKDQIAAVIDAKGQRFAYEYDTAGRTAKRVCPDGETKYGYTARGQLALIDGPDSKVSLEYDARGLCIAEDQDGIRLENEFDELGRPVRLDVAGDETRFGWSPDNDLMKLSRGDLHVTFERDALGRELSRNLPGAGVFAQTYDPLGRVLSQVFTPSHVSPRAQVVGRSYAYDARGRVSAINDSLRGLSHFFHDVNGSLTSVLRPSGSRAMSDFYEVDAEGNRLTQAHGFRGAEMLAALQARNPLHQVAPHFGAASAASVFDQHGRLVRVESVSRKLEYEYDANGCVVRKTETDGTGARTLRLNWNARGQLIEATPADGRTWRYRYDGCGRRIEKRSPDGQVWRFVWDGVDLVQIRLDGKIVARLAYTPESGAPVLRDDGKVHYLLPDHVDATCEVVDAKGELEWAASKGTWGESFRAGVGNEPFLGQTFDAETGLHYNMCRYYDPDIGRHISPDPIDIYGGWNLYAPVRSPIYEVDPLGIASSRDPGAYLRQEGTNEYKSKDGSSARKLGNGNWRVKQKGWDEPRTVSPKSNTITEVTGVGPDRAYFNGTGSSVGHNKDAGDTPKGTDGVGNKHWWHAEINALDKLMKEKKSTLRKGGPDVPISLSISRPPCPRCGPAVGTRGTQAKKRSGLAQRLANRSGRPVHVIYPPKKTPHVFMPEEGCS